MKSEYRVIKTRIDGYKNVSVLLSLCQQMKSTHPYEKWEQYQYSNVPTANLVPT